jgi:hypothetical protein
MKSFRQYITEYSDFEHRGEDPETGRPKEVYTGDFKDLDHHDLERLHNDSRTEVESLLRGFPGGFSKFDDQVHLGVLSGHDNEKILGKHPIGKALDDGKHPMHSTLYQNEHHIEGFMDSKREMLRRSVLNPVSREK